MSDKHRAEQSGSSVAGLSAPGTPVLDGDLASSADKRVLLVLTSHDDLGGVRKTGYFVGEAAHPWRVFVDAGFEVDLASIAGGTPPQDGYDESDEVQRAFLADDKISAQLANTTSLDDVDPGAYDAVVLVGGHGTMWDFPDSIALAAAGRDIYESGGVVAAVCHGPSGLINMKLSDGTPLIAGKTVAGFTNEEEAAVGLTDTVPFLLADKLTEQGAEHIPAEPWSEHVEVDERLVTGQNPQSAGAVGREVVKLLGG
ncbi:MAG TPA: type 1 glutamine amidotransferase domain-containing protein [Nakamurella sp.]